MAELVLSSALQVIFDKLASFGLTKLGSILVFKANLEKLKRKLLQVEAVLEDAEEKQVTQRAVGAWLSNLKDVVYDVEALLLRISDDERQYADEVKDMLLELEKAADEGLRFKLRESFTVHEGWVDTRETASVVIKSEVYGREKDKEKIVELLLSSEATQEGEGTVSCIPIVGMGGLGKTTLAQLAYNDEKVIQHFHLKVWFCVSHHFDVKNILITVIESITKDKWHLSTMDEAHSKVRELLHNKKYLIVLDNVWTEDQDSWDTLRQVLFETGSDGSRILITTRKRKVAEALIVTHFPTVPYYLGELSDEACWSLFKNRAFRREEEEKHRILLTIGRQIVRKCGGLALAAKTLGSLMRFKRDVKAWEFVQDSELWKLDKDGSGIPPALRLSYSRLPLCLKRCLALCSIFPRNYEFKKEKLIRLWMALGLLQSSKWSDIKSPKDIGNDIKSPEDIGNDYFIDLEWMSFFQEIKQNESGVVIGHKMHDVIYDLVQFVTNSPEYTKLNYHGFAAPTNFRRIRHSSVVCDFKSFTIPEELYKVGHHLRTLLLFSEGNFDTLPGKLCSSLNCLFALDLSGSGLVKLQDTIGAISHLRYLDLSYTHIIELPDAIEGLHSLETLDLFNCYNLVSLPDLTKMKKLRHLNNEGCRKLTQMLVCKKNKIVFFSFQTLPLQTLPLFVIGGFPDKRLLKELCLKGNLKITHMEKLRGDSIEPHTIRGIESLGLYWGPDDGFPNINLEGESIVGRFQERKQFQSSSSSQGVQLDNSTRKELVSFTGKESEDEETLYQMKPSRDLKRLIIKGYPGFNLPSWDVPYLKVLDLINCRQSKYLPPLGNLQFLTSLSLREMHEVRSIGKEFYCEGNQRPFPLLKELVLVDLPNLEQWYSPDNCGDVFPNLRKLILNKCPKLIVMPQMLSLHHLDLRNCSAILLDFFPNLRCLQKLIIEEVEDLLYFSGPFPVCNPHLTTMEIKSCPQLSFLSNELENLAALKSLVIRWCGKLHYLPRSLQFVSALESLEIGDCHGLKSLPDGGNRGLSNLRSLSIENCNNLNSLSVGFRHLTSLEVLSIMCCPSIVALPPSVKHLSALRSLRILWCQKLTFLPDELQNLSVLLSLEIGGCPGLEVLPEWIGKLASLRSLAISDCKNITSLPEGIEHLTALQHLSIQDCPQLQQRCRPETGEDWPKIVHVPYKHIELPNRKRPREEGSSSSNH